MRYFESPESRDRHFVRGNNAEEQISKYIEEHDWLYDNEVNFESRLELAISLSLVEMARDSPLDEAELFALLTTAYKEDVAYLSSRPPGQLRQLMADEYVYLAYHQGELWVAYEPFFPDPDLERLMKEGEPDPPEPPDGKELFGL